MKFVLKVAISNYYETHGNFENIEQTIIGKESSEYFRHEIKDSKTSYSDFLYEQLGYKKINGMSMEDTLKARSLFVVRKNKELKEMFGCNDMNKIRDIFTKNNISLKTFPQDDVTLPDEMRDVINLLAFYYKHDNSIFITGNTKVFPLSVRIEELSGMKNGINKKIDAMLEDKCIADALVKIHYRKNTTIYLQNGECFLPQKFSEDELLKIHRESLKKAAFPLGVDLNSLFKRSWNLVLLSINNNKNYLNLLDYARAIGITYKDLAKYYGISIPNEIPIYAKCGILLYNITSNLYYTIDSTCSEETPIIKNTLQ